MPSSCRTPGHRPRRRLPPRPPPPPAALPAHRRPAPPDPPARQPGDSARVISPLTGILPVQRGPALVGNVMLGDDADQITVEASSGPMLRPPTAASPPALTRIGLFTRRNVNAGKVTFRVPLSQATRTKLGVRARTAITLRVTLRIGQTKGLRSKQVTWKRPVRRP